MRGAREPERTGTGPANGRCSTFTGQEERKMLRFVGIAVLVVVALALLMVFGLLDAIF
ncbi:MAG: hypothetical protein ACXWUN_00070 [Allosphingosinicella sp.]